MIDQYNESVRRLQAEAIALGPTFNFNAAMAQIFQTRLEGFSRGMVDTRDVVYFLSVTAVTLAFAFRALERRKWA